MRDRLTKERRSWNMSRIRGKDTKPEMVVRSLLHRLGYRFRLHGKGLPGRPDIVLARHRVVVLVHGCFWHGHEGCKDFAPPKTRTEWWLNKISGNKKNDAKTIAQLEETGWRVVIVWECELTPKNREKTINSLVDRLNE